MCGIVGAVAKRPIERLLIDGLKKLEYRGYDSAGMAGIDSEFQLKRLRVAGKVRELEIALNAQPLQAYMGIAHTRWATHGAPSEQNAHPFVSHDKIALVHNGIIGVRQGAPLVIGRGQGENFLASDPLALLSVTQQFIYLEDHDIADLTLDAVAIYDKAHQHTAREQHCLSINVDAVERGEYRHYMKKEIMEQPNAVNLCLEGRITKDHVLPAIFGSQAEAVLDAAQHIQLVACGTSYHAAMVARYWIESLAQIPCSIEVASEFRYRDIAQSKNSLFVTLSQSGETADSLAALRLAKRLDYLSSLVICNVPGSTMMREANLHFLTRAGIEIGVASTKAFVTQLTSLLLLA